MNILRGVFLIVSFAVGINSYNGRSLIRLPNPSDISIMDEAVVTVIRNCFPDVIDVLLGGQIASETIRELNGLKTLATLKLNNLSLIDNLQYFHKKIDLLILNDTNVSEFLPPLKYCRRLSVSTNEIMVFLLCKMDKIENFLAKKFFKLWRCNFLNVYSFCLDSKNKLNIFTFNPYTNRTINEWERINFTSDYVRNKLSDRWTFHYRPYLKKNTCQGFIFDRNKNLDGYPVIAAVENIGLSYRQEKVALMIENALNVRIKLKRVSKDFFSNVTGRNRQYDFSLAAYSLGYQSAYFGYSFSQPIRFFSITILTHNRGLLTPLEKIYNYYGCLTVIATMIILAMTFIVIYLSEHDITFASFEILRLLINTGIKTRMDTNKSRIFFSMIFLYFLIIHGTFSGRLAGFLTKAEYRKNVESLEDLKDPRYKQIYTDFSPADYINDIDIKNKTTFGRFIRCKNNIRTNSSVACIGDYINYLPMVKRFKLHTSKKPLLNKYYFHLMRKNWPLESRFNDLMIRCLQSRLSQKWTRDKTARRILKMEIAKARSLRRYRQVTFDDLKFSFLLLGYGLILSMISFIFEIVIQKKYYSKICKKIKRVRTKRWIPIASIRFRIKGAFMKFMCHWELIRRRDLRRYIGFLREKTAYFK